VRRSDGCAQGTQAPGCSARQLRASRAPLPIRATTGTERAHLTSCGEFQGVTEPTRLGRFGVTPAAVRGTTQPERRERMSDDAKFILGIG
jgi:hypothetical protein